VRVQADGKTGQPLYITMNKQDIFGFAGLSDLSLVNVLWSIRAIVIVPPIS
jgi:hypothetical protein